MTCPHCDEHQERIRQLEDELYGRGWEPPRHIHLTASERAILQTLMARDRIISKWTLVNATRGLPHTQGEEVDPKVADVQVCKLRIKLREHGLGDIIETVWAQGYRLTAEGRATLLDLTGRRAA